MTISVWGWGSTTISTWGWGAVFYDYLPEMLAEFVVRYAYTCVLTRDYLEVLDRESGEVIFRLRPDEIPERGYGEVISRMQEGEVLFRTRPDQLLDRSYVEVVERLGDGDVVIRARPDQMSVRERGDIAQRSVDGVLSRSKGWPWQADELCLDDEE